MSKNILITGGAGFIGSNFIKYFLKKYPDYNIIVIDKLTYAGDIKKLDDVKEKIKFKKVDICDSKKVDEIFEKYNINGVIHFAAESHVDNSVINTGIFMQTNIIGTYTLLEIARRKWGEKSKNKFLQVSTDEIYGSLGDDGYFTETSKLTPTNPYSASKASADLIAFAYQSTYNMNINVTNCSNNYGPYQHTEKLIPHMIKLAMENKPLTIHGSGKQIRDWIFVEDHCEAIDLVFHKGISGERYNIGGGNERQNIQIAKIVLDNLNKPYSLIKYVPDRKSNDYRYAMDYTKIRNQLGWIPKTRFEEGIKQTIKWYERNFNER